MSGPLFLSVQQERLIIGKFCQIADGVTFITSFANHRCGRISSYPFAIFDGGPAQVLPSLPDWSGARATVIGPDCWIGQGARILPGALLGNGVIVGASAVVSGSVPSYAIVAGNPAQVVRMRLQQTWLHGWNRLRGGTGPLRGGTGPSTRSSRMRVGFVVGGRGGLCFCGTLDGAWYGPRSWLCEVLWADLLPLNE